MNGRCPTCGQKGITWTPDAILEAIREWTREHGRAPSGNEWLTAGHGHPSLKTVRLHYATFGDARRAAGVEWRPACSKHRLPSEWTQEQIKDAIYRWVYLNNRIPLSAEWRVPPNEDFPSSHAVRSLFGSWNAAIVAAGYQPRIAFRSIDGYRRVAGAATRSAA